MEILVVRFDVPENRDRLADVGRLHDNLLEPAVQGTVLLHDLGELIHGCRSDALQLAPRQGRFEDVGRVKAALRTTGSDNGVELIDEQDDVRIGSDLPDDGFQSFLEIPTVLRPGHHRGYVQGYQAFLRQCRGDLAGRYPQGDALHDRGLSYPWFPDEHRVVLLAPAKNLYDTGDLGLTAHHRIKLSLRGGLGEIEAEILDDTPVLLLLLPAFLCIFSARFVLRPGNAAQQSFITHVAQQTAIVHTMLAKIGLAVILRGAAKSQQKMQGTRFGDPLSGGFQHSDAQDVLGVTGERDLVRFRVRYRFVCEYVAVDEPLETVRVHPEADNDLAGGILAVTQYPQEQVVGADAVASGPHRLVPGVTDYVVEFIRDLYFHSRLSK